jgi:hypothetical protein
VLLNIEVNRKEKGNRVAIAATDATPEPLLIQSDAREEYLRAYSESGLYTGWHVNGVGTRWIQGVQLL